MKKEIVVRQNRCDNEMNLLLFGSFFLYFAMQFFISFLFRLSSVSVVENRAISDTITNVGVLCDSENNSASSSSHEDSDDFVLVPNNLPVDQNVIDYEKR